MVLGGIRGRRAAKHTVGGREEFLGASMFFGQVGSSQGGCDRRPGGGAGIKDRGMELSRPEGRGMRGNETLQRATVLNAHGRGITLSPPRKKSMRRIKRKRLRTERGQVMT